MTATNLLVLASESGIEGVSPDHIAADLAVPLGLLIFAGSLFALLWSNYGWKKGGLILGICTFGFWGLIGVFWWFGAPGTPVATGLQNFPGQAADEYQPKWYPFEPGSDRAAFFPNSTDIDNFLTVEEFTGKDDPTHPLVASIKGDLDGVSSLMIEQWFPTNASGSPDIGASFRTELQQATAAIDTSTLENAKPGTITPTGYVVEVATDADGEKLLYINEENGQRVAAAELVVYATFQNADQTNAGRAEVARTDWFAFKDPGALWLPSAIWTGVSFLLFLLCLAMLDRIEQREKREGVEAEEPMDVQVPVAQ